MTPEAAAMPEEVRFPHWRRNRLAMAAATFLTTSGFGMVNPFLPLVLREMGASGPLETWVGYALGGYFIISFLMTPVWGVVADHYGRKLMALRTSLGMAFIFTLLPLMPSMGWFLTFYFLMGTTNGFIPATNALIVTNTPGRAMGSSLSLVQTGTLIGAACGPALGAALASLLPAYRFLFWVSGALITGAGLLTLALARERHVRPEGPFRPHLVRDFRVIRDLPYIRSLFFLTFVQTFTFLGGAAIVSVFVLELLAARGIQAGPEVDFWVGMATLAFTAASALAVVFWGRVMDRFGAPRILAISLFTTMLASLPILVVQSPAQLAGARFLLGLLGIGLGPSTVTLVKTFAPPGMESRVLSYATAFGALGIGGGPFLAGQIGPLLGLRAYFALNSCLLLVALGVWLRAMSRGAASEAALRA